MTHHTTYLNPNVSELGGSNSLLGVRGLLSCFCLTSLCWDLSCLNWIVCDPSLDVPGPLICWNSAPGVTGDLKCQAWDKSLSVS